MVLLILALALPCSAMSMRTWALGWKRGAVLVALLVCAAAVDFRLVVPEARVTLLVILTFATAATVVAGSNIERRSTATCQAWGTVSRIVTCTYCGVIVAGACGVALLYGINGLPSSTPSLSEILPLPNGLAITENVDEQCGDGSASICTRQIDVSSTDGQSDGAMIHELDARLVANGWSSGVSCRTVGVLLDRSLECVSVEIDHGQVRVELDDSSGW